MSGAQSGCFRCPGCGFVYDPRRGVPHEGFPAGTPFAALPDDWPCPDCVVREKPDFVAESADAPSSPAS